MGMSTSPGRPPPPSAKRTTGSRRRSAVEQTVLLLVVTHALGAGQDGVVVGHGHAALAVDLADARHQPVGRSALDELLPGTPALLSGVHQRSVLDERPGVEKVIEVLAGRAPVLVVTLLHGLRPA